MDYQLLDGQQVGTVLQANKDYWGKIMRLYALLTKSVADEPDDGMTYEELLRRQMLKVSSLNREYNLPPALDHMIEHYLLCWDFDALATRHRVSTYSESINCELAGTTMYLTEGVLSSVDWQTDLMLVPPDPDRLAAVRLISWEMYPQESFEAPRPACLRAPGKTESKDSCHVCGANTTFDSKGKVRLLEWCLLMPFPADALEGVDGQRLVLQTEWWVGSELTHPQHVRHTTQLPEGFPKSRDKILELQRAYETYCRLTKEYQEAYDRLELDDPRVKLRDLQDALIDDGQHKYSERRLRDIIKWGKQGLYEEVLRNT